MTELHFPKPALSLTLTHNEHKLVYESVEEYYNNEFYEGTWVSAEQRLKSLDTQDVWEIHWYPVTPIGSYVLIASDLDVLLEAAKNVRG